MKTEHEAVVRRFHIRQFKWMLIQGIVIVFGSVASLGSIIAYSHTLDDRHDILRMNGNIAPGCGHGYASLKNRWDW